MQMHPATADLIKLYEDGVDAVNAPERMAAVQEALADRIYNLSSDEKGLVIADLLLINRSLEHILTRSRMPELAP